MKPRPRTRRRSQLALTTLENRQLLTGVAATWLGQDGHDLVGPYAAETPDGIQDIHVQITGLPTERQIRSADLRGLGGSQWVYNGEYGPWGAALRSSTGASTADLYVEPDRLETGRAFNLVLTFDDGSTADIWFDGGTADPNLRMPDAQVRASWAGQGTADRTGLGPAVGPDGRVDAVLDLSGLAPDATITTLRIDGPPGISWASGLNSQGASNAEFVRDPGDPTRGQLYFSPDRNLQGQTLSIEVVYETGHTDSTQVAAGATDPLLAVPSTPLPQLSQAVTATWAGQASGSIAGVSGSLGWASIALNSVPAGRTIVAAALSGVTNAIWAYRAQGVDTSTFYTDPYARTLALIPGTTQLAFAPDTQLDGQTLTLRLRFDDGSEAVTRLAAGAIDLTRLSPSLGTSSIVAGDGANLQKLVNQYDRIVLSPGVYRLSQPLVINRPMSLTAPYGGVTLLFSQASTDNPWTAAIKLNAGNTTLQGFSIRFTGSIRWNDSVNYGPAVIGSTDNLDPATSDPKAGIVLDHLDIEAPAATNVGDQAVNLIRLVSAADGRITSNRLRGGTTTVIGGPWTITGNTYLGTMPGTWTWEAFAAHHTNFLDLSSNVATPLSDSGRTWRFLVLTQAGYHDKIQNNQVEGLGPRDTDTTQVNANELILTESYALRFEGVPLGLSSDGMVLKIPDPQGDTPATGDVVAILDGPNAGAWVRVAQVIDRNTLILAAPLPAGTHAISIASGFVGESFTGNSLDIQGTSSGSALVLVGNHYGTVVTGNTTYGGGDAIRVVAFPSESPVQWGWSRSPFLGGVISNNTLVDSAGGLLVSVDHGTATKSTKGRTYLNAVVQNNVIRWTAAFLAARQTSGLGLPTAITIGETRSLDPAELVLDFSGNSADVPAGTALPAAIINSGTINGAELVDAQRVLATAPPSAPATLSLLIDSGPSASDGITNEPGLKVGSAVGAVRYEYQANGSGAFLPVADPNGFVPAGLVQGVNQILVRGVNAEGTAGPAISLAFELDTEAPIDAPPTLLATSDSGLSSTDRLTRAYQLQFQTTNTPGDSLILLRDGVAVATGSNGSLIDPGPVSEGVHQYAVHRTDAAGNVSVSQPLSVTIDRSAPSTVEQLSAAGTTVSLLAPPTGTVAQYRVNSGAYRVVSNPAGFVPDGLRDGSNVVEVRLVDTAGNASVNRSINVIASSGKVQGAWLGQDGKDYVGPSATGGPDGIQDIHIRLTGLPKNRRIRFIDVQGLGGSRWQFAGTGAHWRAALVPQRASGTADLYLQPDRVETGRGFQMLVVYGDGSRSEFWVQGGTANPKLAVPRATVALARARARRASNR